jgi:hypothetical protein
MPALVSPGVSWLLRSAVQKLEYVFVTSSRTAKGAIQYELQQPAPMLLLGCKKQYLLDDERKKATSDHMWGFSNLQQQLDIPQPNSVIHVAESGIRVYSAGIGYRNACQITIKLDTYVLSAQ